MTLEQAVLDGMTFKQLRQAARDLQVVADDYRQRSAVASGLRQSQQATAEFLLGYLSEREVKSLCGRLGVESKGRRRVLIARLIEIPAAGDGSVRGTSERAGERTPKRRKKVTHRRMGRRRSAGRGNGGSAVRSEH